MKLSELDTHMLLELPKLTPVCWYDMHGTLKSRGVLLRVRPDAGDCSFIAVENVAPGDYGTVPRTRRTSLEFVELDTTVLRVLSWISSELEALETQKQVRDLTNMTAHWRQSLAHLPPSCAPPPEFWALYASMPDWELKADELTMLVGNIALEELRPVNALGERSEAENIQSWNRCVTRVHELLERPEFRRFGAADTEGREAAHRLLQSWYKYLCDATPPDLS